MSPQLANSLPVNCETTSDEDGGQHNDIHADFPAKDAIDVRDSSDAEGTSEDNFVRMSCKIDLYIKVVIH